MRINVANANKVDKLLEVSGANAKNNANANAKQHRLVINDYVHSNTVGGFKYI